MHADDAFTTLHPSRLTGLAALLTLMSIAGQAWAQPAAPPVALESLPEILQRFDDDLRGGDGQWQLQITDRPVLVITDAAAGRMRIMTPVAESRALTQEDLYRLMQANFESALDVRYAIANDALWSVFIHPLEGLTEDELVSAIAQTVTLAQTYGSSFSSGALSFGGGDHGESLFESLREQGTLL